MDKSLVMLCESERWQCEYLYYKNPSLWEKLKTKNDYKYIDALRELAEVLQQTDWQQPEPQAYKAAWERRERIIKEALPLLFSHGE